MRSHNSFVYKYRYDPELNLLVEQLEGTCGWHDVFEAIKKGAEEIALRPDFQPMMDKLSDLSGASPDTDFDGARQFVVQITATPILRFNRFSVFAPEPMQFGIARMHQVLSEERDNYGQIRVFKEFPEARNWLGLPDDFELGL